MKAAYISSTQCTRRSLDANKISRYLIKNGYSITCNPKKADVIILVTCSFRKEETVYWLKKISYYSKFNSRLIVAGCLPAIDKKKLNNIFDGDVIITKDINKINSLISEINTPFELIDDSNIQYINLSTIENKIKKLFCDLPLLNSIYIKLKTTILNNILHEKSFFKHLITRYFYIRISWGCSGSCSYCAIKKAIGPYKSKPAELCLTELSNGLNFGFKNFYLTADDVGPYGLDINTSLPKLLEKMLSVSGNYSISIQHLSPQWIVKYIDDLEKILMKGKINHILIPIQSANKRILNLMCRYSDVDRFKDSLLRLKSTLPTLCINADFMIGFPTETWEEFYETLKFIRDMKIEGGCIFPFSLKSDTKAEKLMPKISQKNIAKRLNYAKKFLKKNGKYIALKKSNSIIFSKK